MAKKYLLYIHTPRFEKETKKSQLVNDLLAKYYAIPDEPGPEETPRFAEDIKNEGEVIEIPFLSKTCKHGYNPQFCKHAKNGKPCK